MYAIRSYYAVKNTVDHVVTEYGVAELRGRSIRERSRALIDIALHLLYDPGHSYNFV